MTTGLLVHLSGKVFRTSKCLDGIGVVHREWLDSYDMLLDLTFDAFGCGERCAISLQSLK